MAFEKYDKSLSTTEESLYVSTGILMITISDASCSRSCNFLTRGDLSLIFKYVVSSDMNFIHKKILVLKL